MSAVLFVNELTELNDIELVLMTIEDSILTKLENYSPIEL
jgi:hypothetical protein